MSRRRLIAVGGLAAACVVALVLVATLGGGGDDAPAPRGDVAISTSIAPSPLFFGDLVTARAQVLVNRRELDPDTVRLEAAFAPFSLVGRPQESRTDERADDLDRRALHLAVPGRSVPAAARRDRAPEASGAHEAEQRQPRHVQPRLAARRRRLARRAGRARDRPAAVASADRAPRGLVPPGARERSPRRSRLAAVLLVLGAFALVVREVTRRRRLLLERARFRSALARALELARASAARGPDDRRRALALLARVLAFDPNGGRRLAPAAARLAWGRSEPSATGLESLVDEIERTVSVR